MKTMPRARHRARPPRRRPPQHLRRPQHLGAAQRPAHREEPTTFRDRHGALLGNAGSLLATTVVTSAAGFVFWAVAARMLPVASLGEASSAVSAMTLLGTLGMLGFGAMLIGELSKAAKAAPGLVGASLIFCAAVGAFLAVLVVASCRLLGIYPALTASPWAMALVVVGSGLTAAAFVLDQALIGLLAGNVQLARNTAFAVIKLGVLLVTARALSVRFGTGVLFAWVVGTVLSLVVIGPLLWKGHAAVLFRAPDWAALRLRRGLATSHTFLNFATQAPRLTLPILATGLVSPAAGGAFYVAFMLAQFLYYVPTSLSTALFALSAGNRQALRRQLRTTLTLSLVAGVVGIAGVAEFGRDVLGLFGHDYRHDASALLVILAIAYFPMAVKVQYVAVVRVLQRLRRGAAIAMCGAALEVGLGALGAVHGGARGLCLGFLVAVAIEALITGPTVLRAARGAPRHA